jgi:thiol-disulfide isomerase/thioredoxin
MYFKKLILALIIGMSFFAISCADQQEATDFTLKDLSGNNVSLSDYRGKVVFLDFWATWCPPCRMSIPEVEQMYEEYKENDNIVMLGINMAEDKNEVEKFIEKNKISYKVLLGDAKTANQFAIRGIPAFFIIDQNGNIYNKFVGFTPGLKADWQKSIKELLK